MQMVSRFKVSIYVSHQTINMSSKANESWISAKLGKLMLPMEEEQIAKARAEEAWIKYGKSIEPHVGIALARKIRRDLSDREILKDLEVKFFSMILSLSF